jgi:hypothetical protein
VTASGSPAVTGAAVRSAKESSPKISDGPRWLPLFTERRKPAPFGIQLRKVRPARRVVRELAGSITRPRRGPVGFLTKLLLVEFFQAVKKLEVIY